MTRHKVGACLALAHDTRGYLRARDLGFFSKLDSFRLRFLMLQHAGVSWAKVNEILLDGKIVERQRTFDMGSES
jgi:hypothetical protein